jgi:hypothetical protein
MNNRKAWRTISGLFFTAICLNLYAFDLETRNGVKYEDARFHKYSKGYAEIRHRYGAVNIPLNDLPVDFLKKLITERKLKVNLKLKPKAKNEIWGYTDSKGRPFIKPQFEFAWYFKKGIALAQQNKKWGFIDQAGNFVIPCKFDELECFSCGLAQAELNGKWGYIDTSGKTVIPFIFDETKKFAHNEARVKQNGKWGFINTKGEFFIKPQYDEVGDFSFGSTPARIGNKWGYINKQGKFIIEPQYEVAAPFFGDITSVQINGKWGYINKKGKIVIKPIYKFALPFNPKQETAWAILDNKLHFIDRTGKTTKTITNRQIQNFMDEVQLEKVFLDAAEEVLNDYKYPEDTNLSPEKRQSK